MSVLKIAKGVRGDNWSEGWLRNRWPDFKAQRTSRLSPVPSSVPGSLLAPHAGTAQRKKDKTCYRTPSRCEGRYSRNVCYDGGGTRGSLVGPIDLSRVVRLPRSLSVLWAQRSDGDDEVLGFTETGGWHAFVLLVG